MAAPPESINAAASPIVVNLMIIPLGHLVWDQVKALEDRAFLKRAPVSRAREMTSRRTSKPCGGIAKVLACSVVICSRLDPAVAYNSFSLLKK
jgi:hypothetical protein